MNPSIPGQNEPEDRTSEIFFSGFIGSSRVESAVQTRGQNSSSAYTRFSWESDFNVPSFSILESRGMRVIVKVPSGFFKKSSPFSFPSLNFHKALTHRMEML